MIGTVIIIRKIIQLKKVHSARIKNRDFIAKWYSLLTTSTPCELDQLRKNYFPALRNKMDKLQYIRKKKKCDASLASTGPKYINLHLFLNNLSESRSRQRTDSTIGGQTQTFCM